MAEEKSFDHKGRMIRDEIETSATPRQAWEAWADPEKICPMVHRSRERRSEARRDDDLVLRQVRLRASLYGS